jgi:hypothetical protein
MSGCGAMGVVECARPRPRVSLLKPRSGAGRRGDREHPMHEKNANHTVKRHLVECPVGDHTLGRFATHRSYR